MCSFLACARVEFWPACLVVSCGCRKSGGPVVWFSPRFFFFLCGADGGGESAASTLGVAFYQVELHLRVSPLV